MDGIEKDPAAVLAEKLVYAYMLVSNSSFIAVASDDRDLTNDEISLLRNYLPDAEDALGQVLVGLIGHTFKEIE